MEIVMGCCKFPVTSAPGADDSKRRKTRVLPRPTALARFQSRSSLKTRKAPSQVLNPLPHCLLATRPKCETKSMLNRIAVCQREVKRSRALR